MVKRQNRMIEEMDCNSLFMTGQVSDIVIFEGEEYYLSGIDGTKLPSPQDFGISPRPASTACWRGFQNIYTCPNNELTLDTMYLSSAEAKPVNGVEPESNGVMFPYIYKNLDFKVPFTGRIIIAKDFISENYVHMGFQSASSYETVLELVLDEGNINSVTDMSVRMKKLREEGTGKPPSPKSDEKKDVKEWISDRFSLEYESE